MEDVALGYNQLQLREKPPVEEATGGNRQGYSSENYKGDGTWVNGCVDDSNKAKGSWDSLEFSVCLPQAEGFMYQGK